MRSERAAKKKKREREQRERKGRKRKKKEKTHRLFLSFFLSPPSNQLDPPHQVIGADGANSRIAKEIDAGEYDYAIAFQERIRIPEDKMDYYRDLAEMYVGDDVSPDFYGWVFPKYDHVAVGELVVEK